MYDSGEQGWSPALHPILFLMRTRLFLALIVALLFTSVSAKRVFFVNGNKHNCGVISDTLKMISHEFVVRNISEEPQTFRSVVIGCNCLTAEYSTDSVMVGDSTIIKLTLDLSMVEPGDFNKPINIKDWLGNSYYLALVGTLVSTEAVDNSEK